MFRLLSVHPGPDFDVSAAAALAGVTVAQARRLLERLVADHLVQSRSPGRYDLHDLLRVYSAELCGDDEAAALRLTEWYVHTLQNAADTHPAKQMLRAGELTTGVVPQVFTDRFEALAWCRNEWDNLSAVLRAALHRGWGRLAQVIPAHLRTHTLVERVRFQDLVGMFEAVQGYGSAREQGLIRVKLAAQYVDVRRYEDALCEFEKGLPLVRASGERLAEVSALNNMSIALLALGRREEALAVNHRTFELSVEIGDLTMEAICAANIVGALNDLRRYPDAVEAGVRARSAIRRLGDEYLEARLDNFVGPALAEIGRHEEGLTVLERCIEGLRRFSDLRSLVITLEDDLAVLLFRMGRHDDAVRAWEEALDVARSTENPRAEGLEAKLALVRGPGPA